MVDKLGTFPHWQLTTPSLRHSSSCSFLLLLVVVLAYSSLAVLCCAAFGVVGCEPFCRIGTQPLLCLFFRHGDVRKQTLPYHTSAMHRSLWQSNICMTGKLVGKTRRKNSQKDVRHHSEIPVLFCARPRQQRCKGRNIPFGPSQ